MKLIALLSLPGLVAAQVGPYGQCGGSEYSGSTTCQSGWVCEYQNQWYSQCVAASASETTLITTTKATFTAPSITADHPATTSKPATTVTDFPATNGLGFTIDGETKYFAGSNSY